MSDFTLMKIRLRGGDITEIQIEEILELDGSPFVSASSVDSQIDGVIDSLNHTNGRLTALENLIHAMVIPNPPTTGNEE